MTNGQLTLRQWRLLKEISQQEMADKIGVHVNTYAAWERNPGMIELQFCQKIADVLGEKTESIFLAYLVNNLVTDETE